MRRVVTSLIAAGASALTGAALVRGVVPLGGGTPVSDQLTQATHNTILSIGALVALWYFLTAAGALIASACRGAGAAPRHLERLVTRFGAPVLRHVLTWTAVSTLSIAAPALAETAAPEPEPTATLAPSSDPRERNAAFLVDLGWAADADSPRGGGAAAEPLEQAEAAHSPAGAPTHTVSPGETLWSIAEADLRRTRGSPTAAEVADHWPRWYDRNVDTIGADPHLIRPGITLHAPTKESP